LIPPESHPSAQPNVFTSPQKPIPAPNLFPPDAYANPRGAVGGTLLNRLLISSLSPLRLSMLSQSLPLW
jgi:hypothetical protein